MQGMNMTEEAISTVHICKEIVIAASMAEVFESVLAMAGPENERPDGVAMPMVLEAWPGGRWFRDLGEGVGHWWGQVQVIKPPTLLEIHGPMFMSYPAVSHVQYRLTAAGEATRLTLTHRAMGQIPEDHRRGVAMGWEHGLNKIRERCEGPR